MPQLGEETLQGYEPPRSTQFSIFLDNRIGKLFDLVDLFRDQAVTLAGMSITESTEFAVVRLLTSNAPLTRQLLEQHKLPFSEIEVLAVELDGDRTLMELCRVLLGAELSIQHVYPLLVQPHGKPVIALRTDDLLMAGQILRRKLFTLLAENDLGRSTPGGSPGEPYHPD